MLRRSKTQDDNRQEKSRTSLNGKARQAWTAEITCRFRCVVAGRQRQPGCGRHGTADLVHEPDIAAAQGKIWRPAFPAHRPRPAPHPFAENMRLRIRSLAAEAENLMDYSQQKPEGPAAPDKSGWEQPLLMKAPPLSLRPSVVLEGQPTPEHIADRLARIGHNADPRHRLAKYIATSAMGIGNSRPLAQGRRWMRCRSFLRAKPTPYRSARCSPPCIIAA